MENLSSTLDILFDVIGPVIDIISAFVALAGLADII